MKNPAPLPFSMRVFVKIFGPIVIGYLLTTLEVHTRYMVRHGTVFVCVYVCPDNDLN